MTTRSDAWQVLLLVCTRLTQIVEGQYLESAAHSAAGRGRETTRTRDTALSMFSLRTYFCRICPCPAPNAALSSTAHARAQSANLPMPERGNRERQAALSSQTMPTNR